MRIKTSYDCEIEPRDMVNLNHGHALTATLSDGSVAFRFHMAPELVQQNGTRRVIGVEKPVPLLGDGTKKKKTPAKNKGSWGKRGMCPYCGAGPILLAPHINEKHPGKPRNLTGKLKCAHCPERYDNKWGLAVHTRMKHPKAGES